MSEGNDLKLIDIQRHEVHFDALPEVYHAVFINLLHNKRVIASCQLHQWDSDTPSLCWLYVEPACRRLGLGRVLVKKAVEECQTGGKNSLILSVGRTNTAAQTLYRSEGFTHHQQDAGNLYMVKLFR
jgi:ribosomal protein S18 acetylase RimI-like enzyme